MQRVSVITILGLVLIVSLTGCQKVFESPSDVVRGFFKAVEKGDYSKAKSYMASSELEKSTASEFKGAVEWVSEQGGIKKIDITKEEVRGEIAEVGFQIEFRDGETLEDTGYLVKEKGRWKMTEISYLESPSDVVLGLVKAYEERDYSKAMGYFASESEKPTLSEFKEGIEDLFREKGGIKRIVITKEEVRGKFAEVGTRVEFGNGETSEEVVHLVKEKGKWKIIIE